MKITALKGNFGSLEYYVAMLDAAELAPVFNPFYQSAEKAIKDGTDNAYSRAQRLLDMPHVRKIVKYLSRSIRFFSSPSAACRMKIHYQSSFQPSCRNDTLKWKKRR